MVFELQKHKLSTRAVIVRVAIAAFLVLQMSVSAAAVEAAPFQDVSSRHQYYAVIIEAVDEKVVSGVGGLSLIHI